MLFSIGQAFRSAGSKVLYFAAYRKMIDRYHVAEIEAASDVVVWCCDEGPGFAPGRPDDKSFVGNIVQGMTAYATGALGEQTIAFADADRVIAIGSDKMMAAVAAARHSVLKAHLKASHRGIASINCPEGCKTGKGGPSPEFIAGSDAASRRSPRGRSGGETRPPSSVASRSATRSNGSCRRPATSIRW